MPVSLQPGVVFDAWLPSDNDLDPRPTFHYRSMNAATAFRVKSLIRKLRSGEKIEDAEEQCFEMLSSAIVGWSNMGGKEFSKDSIQELLNMQEGMQLLWAMATNFNLSESERKKSESPSLEHAGNSAQDAASDANKS